MLITVQHARNLTPRCILRRPSQPAPSSCRFLRTGGKRGEGYKRMAGGFRHRLTLDADCRTSYVEAIWRCVTLVTGPADADRVSLGISEAEGSSSRGSDDRDFGVEA